MQTTTLTDATAVRSAVLAEVAAHRKFCGCWPAGEQAPRPGCDDGWNLAKRLAAARSEVAYYQSRLVDGWPSLF